MTFVFVDTTGLESLAELIYLNLSYNQLTYVPITHEAAPLTRLMLAYNNIEQLLAVSELTNLEHLDLAGNCLMHHDALAPVSGLARLLSTDLRHNPLSTHPRHREIASSWLHPALASLGPSLDTVPLSRSELLHVGSSRLIVSPSVSPARPVSGDQDQEAALATLDSLETDFHESVSAVGSREGSTVSGFTVSTVSGRTRRRRRRGRKKIREAVITDTEATDTATTETEAAAAGDQEAGGVTVQLQGLRERYGDTWLNSGASETLNTILGIKNQEIREEDTIGIEKEPSEEKGEVGLMSTGDQMESTKAASRRRSSDEIPDAIDKADDIIGGEDVKEETKMPTETAETKPPGEEQSFYSMYGAGDRAASSSPEQAAQCRVAVLRTIPGDDSGLAEELWLAMDREFIREQEAGGGGSGAQRTRVKWFTHSLEQVELVQPPAAATTGHSDHVTGDKVRLLGHLNQTFIPSRSVGLVCDAFQHGEEGGSGEVVHDDRGWLLHPDGPGGRGAGGRLPPRGPGHQPPVCQVRPRVVSGRGQTVPQLRQRHGPRAGAGARGRARGGHGGRQPRHPRLRDARPRSHL